jgi:mono/diheme cytochrome c family protein
VRELHVSMAPERVARGQHIANAMCADCHTKNKQLPLSGGNNLSEDAHMPLGDLVPFNLTPGGPLKDWTDGEIFRAIREAADKDGRKLPVMSSQHVRYLSDEDLESVIAYLRSQPAVNAATTPERFSLLSVVFAGANMLPIVDTLPPSTIAPPDRATATSYGKYIVGWYGCQECHGEKLQGGGGGVLPVGPDLRSVQGWTEAGFVTALRTGVTPFGKTLDSTMMPWKNAGRLDDDELRSVYAYLKSLPSVVQAGR